MFLLFKNFEKKKSSDLIVGEGHGRHSSDLYKSQQYWHSQAPRCSSPKKEQTPAADMSFQQNPTGENILCFL